MPQFVRRTSLFRLSHVSSSIRVGGRLQSPAEKGRRGDIRMVEFLESRRMLSGNPAMPAAVSASSDGPAIESFSLVNAKDNAVIRPIMDGDVVDLTALGLRRKDVNVRANFADGSTVGSVKYDLSGATTYHHTENHNGYYLFGGKGSNVGSNNNRLAFGRNVVTATAFSGSKTRGASGESQTFAFDLIEDGGNGGSTAAPGTGVGAGTGDGSDAASDVGAIAIVELVDADNGQDIVQLSGYQQTVSLSTADSNSLSVVARTVGPIGSVTFKINDGNVIYENHVPYALFGDTVVHLNPGSFSPGLNTITMFPYSGRDGTGTAGPIVVVSFMVSDGSGT